MVLAFGPKSRQKPEKPLTLPPGAPRRGEAGGRVDGRSGGRSGGRGGGRGGGGGGSRAGRHEAPPPAAAAPDMLQRLATGVQKREEGRGPVARDQRSKDTAAAVPRRQPRHLKSAVGELLGGPALPAAQEEESWDSQDQEEEAGMLRYLPPQQPHHLPPQQARELPPPRAVRLPSQPEASEAPAADFTRRDAARLGGDGVAGIFGGADGAGAVRQSGGYMAALSSIKPGLSDAQKAKQAAQREQLKRELEEQIQEKRAAEARRKAELAAQEEEEERKLRAYWAAQAAQAAAEREGAAGRQNAAAGNSMDRAQHGGGAAVAPALVAKGRAVRTQGAAEPLGAPAGNPTPSKRGEALVQPGVTVFLPPDRAAERRGALRARQQSEACSQDAEAVQPLPAGGSDHQAGPAAAGAGAAVAAWHQLQELAGSQYPAAAAALLAQQQAAAALLAAANPAMAPGALPLYPYSPMLLPSLAAAGVGAGAGPAQQAPAPVASAADPQVLGLLRELQQEQRRMREQLEAVAGDATEARSERDRARQDLERVQRLLAERQAGQQQGWGATQGASFSSDGGCLAVTSHVLPIGAARIPSRLGSPAAPGAVQQEVEGGQLPARYRQQPTEPWQKQEQRAGGTVVGGASTKQAGNGTKQAGKRQGWGQPGAGLQAKGKPGPTGAKPGPTGVKPPPVKGWRK